MTSRLGKIILPGKEIIVLFFGDREEFNGITYEAAMIDNGPPMICFRCPPVGWPEKIRVGWISLDGFRMICNPCMQDIVEGRK